MSPETSAINTLSLAADKAASRCSFCNEFGHTKFDCIRFVFSRLEKIEIAMVEGGVPEMQPRLIVLLVVVGGIVGAIIEHLMRGLW
jgi:hypothetical protein